MKRPLAIASTVVAAAAPAAAGADKEHHVRGCNTTTCDKRIGKRWARRHHQRKPQALAVASWYGPGFYGHRTACGQTLEPGTVGVAHKVLACGTRIRLCVRRCIVAPVIDRGPYVGGRTFDLTAPVKDAVGMAGVATVRYQVIG
jgi:rare lipoprotein A (peptidoglycan hydrolase)